SQEYVDLLAGAAEWCYELGDATRAVPWLEQLTERRGQDGVAWFRLGTSLLRSAEDKARAAAAASALARSAALAPGDDGVRRAVMAAWVRAAELAEGAGHRD